jgi:FHS family Na+ dependent glucose MFS transporter 1
LAGCLLSVGILLLLPGNRAAAWVGTFGVGLSMASIFPTAISLAERRMRITGTITSVFFVGGSLGGMSIPWLIGQLFETTGPQVTMLAITIAVVLDVLTLALILAHTRSRSKGG